MQENDCIRFLQWALPHLQMRWEGFRKVRKRICKRLAQRLMELGLSNLDAYQNHLFRQPAEWQRLDTLCRVVVTRFYRDQRVFDELAARVLPQLATDATVARRPRLDAWSIGSASGEEPYTLAILWHHLLAPRFPQLQFAVLATEIDAHLIKRSRHACYSFASIKNLPAQLRSDAFTLHDAHYCLKADYRTMVEFRQQDIRTALPSKCFDLILCRNLVFTYFDAAQQRAILQRVVSCLRPGGWLVLGVHEHLPDGTSGLQVVSERLGLYRFLS